MIGGVIFINNNPILLCTVQYGAISFYTGLCFFPYKKTLVYYDFSTDPYRNLWRRTVEVTDSGRFKAIIIMLGLV